MSDCTPAPESGGGRDAPLLTTPLQLRLVQREVLALIVLSVLAAAAFGVTRAAATANQRQRLHDASAWYARGQTAIASGDTAKGVAALQHASGIDRDNLAYRMALARALSAAHQQRAARQLLLAVRERRPEDPDVNLALARLSVAAGDDDDAQRYYRYALYGAWRAEDATARRAARIEFVRYLLEHGARQRAVSELIVLAGNLPDQPDAHIAAGELFMKAKEPQQALNMFEDALAREPGNQVAAAGAGTAAFALQDYPRALRYLRRAAADPHVPELRMVAELVLSQDPLRPRLSADVRWQRAVAGLTQARQWLDACAAGDGANDTALQPLRSELESFTASMTRRAVRRSPALVEDAASLVVRAVRNTTAVCGVAAPQERAWQLIGRLRDLETQ